MPHSTGTAAIPAPGAAPLDTIAARSLGVNGFPSLAARRLSLTRGTAQRSPCLPRPACGGEGTQIETPLRQPLDTIAARSLGVNGFPSLAARRLSLIRGAAQRSPDRKRVV